MKYFLLMFLILFQIILELNFLFPKEFSNVCEIKIKIKGKGRQYILGDSRSPDNIYLGDEKNERITGVINLTENENTIILSWNSTFQNCHRMFYGCSNITEIDFSSFNNPDIIDMSEMFRGCISLTSINFSSFYISNITSMYGMFEDCKTLRSLNLSTFNTSNVLNMGLMFYNCISLTSLDLSNFNTFKVGRIIYMFCYCRNLSFLDISSFKTPNLKESNVDVFRL